MSNANILLGVNIDHAATLRQARFRDIGSEFGPIVEPDPVAIALLAEEAGADGITVHPREDERHIQREDVRLIREKISTRLNMEMAATDEMLAFALEILPDSICIVPESREEVTTEGGLDVVGNFERIKSIVVAASKAGIVTSLFIDPESDQIAASAESGATHIELHTGAYANAYYRDGRAHELGRLLNGAKQGSRLNLTVNAGHGINYTNIEEIRTIPRLHELNIGHSIISRALFSGISEAVQKMKALINGQAFSGIRPMTLDFRLPPAGPLLGLGVDIVDITRIKGMRSRQGERFLKRVYTQTELDYCMKMKYPDQHLAARFAAKEAVSKAFTTGIGEYFDWKSIGVVVGARRQPEIELDEKAQRFMESLGGTRISISLTHSENTAIAIAGLIGQDETLPQ